MLEKLTHCYFRMFNMKECTVYLRKKAFQMLETFTVNFPALTPEPKHDAKIRIPYVLCCKLKN